eukprot:scaffold88792_cov64-Phaeocystis_antarctica.AAC.3
MLAVYLGTCLRCACVRCTLLTMPTGALPRLHELRRLLPRAVLLLREVPRALGAICHTDSGPTPNPDPTPNPLLTLR